MFVVVQEVFTLRVADVVVTSHEEVIVVLVHDISALLVFHIIDGDGDAVHVGLGDEVLTVGSRQLVPIPPRDDIVESVAVALVVDRHLVDRFALSVIRANLHLLATLVGIVGIKVGLHIKQLQLSV